MQKARKQVKFFKFLKIFHYENLKNIKNKRPGNSPSRTEKLGGATYLIIALYHATMY